MNDLTIYRAHIVYQKEPIYEFSKESKNFHKFNKYNLYCTHIAL